MKLRKENFNSGWRFAAGEHLCAEQITYDDVLWQPVELPHDWSIAQEFASNQDQAGLPIGIVWYRKRFTVHLDKNEKLLLDCDGIYRSPDIFLNGQYLGKRYNGYSSFEIDLTPALVEGENLLAIRVDNSIKRTSRWYTGTGINRNIYLRRIKPQHFLRHGLAINTDIDGTVRLAAELSALARLEFEITGPDGEVIARPVADSMGHAECKIVSPQLWSPDAPNLYKCLVRIVSEKGEILDEATSAFGFRTVEFSPEKGLIFNGRKLLLRGINLHEELCGIGCTAFRDGIRRRYRLAKEMGVNAVRLAHHPYSPEYLELADEMGLIVFAEAYDKWTGQYNGWQVDFRDTWRGDVTEMIRRDRNHPSIFIWSVGNEPTLQQIEGADNYGIDIFRPMRDLVRELDPARKVTAALYPSRCDGITNRMAGYEQAGIHQLAHVMDVVSVNYMGKFFGKDHAKHPEMVFMVSEATTKGATDWFEFDHQIGVGLFYWGGFDYLGEALWPHKNWHRGLIDRAGFRKGVSYQAEAAWSERSVLFAAVCSETDTEVVNWNDAQLVWESTQSHWNWQPGQNVRLAVYTNCERVELTLNGRPAGDRILQATDYCRMPFELKFEPGELLISAFNDGVKIVEHRLVTAGSPAQLQLCAEQQQIRPDGLNHIVIELKDAAGVPCAQTPAMVHLYVEGAGELYGVSQGDTKSYQQFKASSVRLYEGRALAVVRANRTTGRITVRAIAEYAGEKFETQLQFPVG